MRNGARWCIRTTWPQVDAAIADECFRNAATTCSSSISACATQTGHWVWVVSRGTVTDRAADGTPLRVVGTQIDITARKMAEFALKESERKFRSLFERSPVGIALTDYQTRRFLQVNDAFLEPGGYTPRGIAAP